MADNKQLNFDSLPQDDNVAMVRNAGVSCSVHIWNYNLRDSLPHLKAVVTPEICVYVANFVFQR